MLTAIFFITSILAVGNTGTLEVSRDAASVRTLELISTTSYVLTKWHSLVIAAGAIWRTVAYPNRLDACDFVLA